MPLRQNPHVKRLLSWHGHDSGGVHVPFQQMRSPLDEPIETGLIRRLRSLAKALATGNVPVPRWIFLVGGPGNGKSETVQAFLTHLDNQLGMGGQLCRVLEMKFRPDPLSPRRIEVESSDLAPSPGMFASKIGRLLVVQDATATDAAQGNAARELAEDISSLIYTYKNAVSGTSPLPVFIACANRGILARALREALQAWGPDDDTTKLIISIIRATSIGVEVSSSTRTRPKCWPLEFDPLGPNPLVACWPLDLESLLVAHGSSISPVQQIFNVAIQEDAWKICSDCDSAPYCPFKQNAVWLSDSSDLKSLLTILRRGELFTGQRWNFRDTFSLAAEITVGQWSDFEDYNDPCEWIHAQISQLVSNVGSPERIVPIYTLLSRLYPHALFSEVYPRLEENVSKLPILVEQDLSRSLLAILSNSELSSLKPIREILLEDYSDLDPASFTPPQKSHTLREIEDDYSQSIEQGNDILRNYEFALVERLFLEYLQEAEREWDQGFLSRKATQVAQIVSLLRRFASTFVKRSIGVRKGYHAYEGYLAEFENSIRDPSKLSKVRDALQHLLGDSGLTFNMLESFGQPGVDQGGLIVLTSRDIRFRPIPAPTPSADLPFHDIPFFEIGERSRGVYRVPLTFAFYHALRIRDEEGCVSSSLPASVRAAIDRVRHRYAGDLCRNRGNFVDGATDITLGDQRINLSDEEGEPWLSPM
jgi:hypothetical protein